MFARKPRDDRGVQERAASLLVTDGALVALSQADALAVVRHMRPHRLGSGTVLMRQGEHGAGDSMALILSGEVTVESESASEGLVVSVLGPGSLIGELGLIDQAARSATCTAAADLALAVLTREVNRRRDSAEAYTAGNRPELAEKETAEAELIGRYLPAPLTEAELDALVAEEVAAAEASAAAKPTMKQMGQIIRAVNGRAQGRAQGGEIAAKVRAALG